MSTSANAAWRLSVSSFLSDPPVVALKLGSNLDETDIKEGDDVYFECDVTSNPEAYKVTWKRNVRSSLMALLFLTSICGSPTLLLHM